jgi:phosphonate transport system substrate-binding protein
MHHRNFLIGKIFLALIGLTFIYAFLFLQNGQAQTSKGTLKLAIIPHRSTLGNEHAYGMLIEALEKETGITFQWTGSKTYDEVIMKIGTKQANIGYVGAFGYVEAQDNFGVRLIARTYGKKKRESYYSMIITREDSGLKSLQDLRGRSFVFNDPKSTSGFLFPMVALKKAGIKMENFSEVKHVTRHANSLLAVYNKHVDAGAISSTAKEKVNVDFRKINILWKSGPIYRGPWIANKDLSDEQFYKIQSALLKISNYKDAEKIFKDLGTKGFIKGHDSDYDNIREVRKLMQEVLTPK